MEKDFWHERWHRGEIAFHEQQANAQLVANIHKLNLPAGACLFLPLCGKTNDIPWLLDQGYSVVGVELSPVAVSALFEGLQVDPTITASENVECYSAKNLTIYCGDFFDLTQDLLGEIDAIYDRAALVALPDHMRSDYAVHLRRVTGTAPQLLITFDYQQPLMPGPPFSVNADEVKRLYADQYSCEMLASEQVQGGLKGKVQAASVVWHLHSPN